MRITIRNWREFNPRKDVTHSSWFRLNHNFFEDPDFYDFTPSELLAWIYILCVASKKNTDTVRVNILHLERVGRIKEKDFLAAVRKLESLQVILVDVTDTLRGCDEHDTPTNATRRDETNVTNETRRTDSSVAVASTAPAAPVAQLVGDYSPKAKTLLCAVPAEMQESWIAAYPDPAWIKQEINKAAAWISANPKKAPKKFPAFMSNWLSRGWEQFRKTLPSNKPGSEESDWAKREREKERRNAV